MQTMYYIGLDIHKRKISYCVNDSRRRHDWAKLKCLLRLCAIAPASLTGTVWNKKDSGA